MSWQRLSERTNNYHRFIYQYMSTKWVLALLGREDVKQYLQERLHRSALPLFILDCHTIRFYSQLKTGFRIVVSKWWTAIADATFTSNSIEISDFREIKMAGKSRSSFGKFSLIDSPELSKRFWTQRVTGAYLGRHRRWSPRVWG